jgi:signal transduction histidine kinase
VDTRKGRGGADRLAGSPSREKDGRAIFEVEDGCGGIREELLPRLFQPFSRVSADRTRRFSTPQLAE